jgi:hypothetical protein
MDAMTLPLIRALRYREEKKASKTMMILKEGRIFTEEAMSETIRLSSKKTFYTLRGDIFAWICSVSSLLLLAKGLFLRDQTGQAREDNK